jgi:ABC-type branched-subunit amino acid transport system permease subunit
MGYISVFGVYFCQVLLLALGVNSLFGFGGLLSLALVAWQAVAAYTYAIASTRLGCGPLSAACIAIAAAVMAATLSALVSCRLSDDDFAVSTLGIYVIVSSACRNIAFLGGTLGISGIPSVGGDAVIFIVTAVACVIWLYIHQTPWSRWLIAVRDDERRVSFLGVSDRSLKASAIAISAAFAGLSGVIVASSVSYIDPGTFSLAVSLEGLAVVIVGGLGSFSGTVAGALILLGVPEVLRWINVPVESQANIRQILVGLVLLMFVALRPNGLLGRFRVE